MKRCLNNLETLASNLVSIRNKFNVLSGHELGTYRLKQAIKLIQVQISETIDYIIEEERKEEEKREKER